MATEQLPDSTYSIAGQETLANWEIISNVYGIEEDAEEKMAADGQWKAKITYSRRETLSLELEALDGADLDAYQGGQVASGAWTLSDGATATAWNIVSSNLTRTKGVATLSLELVQQGDTLS